MKINVYPIIALLASVSLACGEPVGKPGDVKGEAGDVTVTYYDIEGKSPEQVRAQLNLHRPHDGSGASYDAHTTWSIRWNWPGYNTAGGDVTRAEVTCNATIVMPRLKNVDSLPADLKGKWNQYVEKLMQHEMGHVAIARELRAAVEKIIKASPPLEAEKAATALLNDYRNREVLYDKRTNHGMNDGAKFP